MQRQLNGMRYVVLAMVCVTALAMAAPAALGYTVYGAPLEAGWHLDGNNANFAVNSQTEPPAHGEIGLKAYSRTGAELPQDAGTYVAQAGTAWYGDGGYDVALWNVAVSIAFGYEWSGGDFLLPTIWHDGIALLSQQPSYGGPGMHSHFGNQTVRLAIDFDPLGGGAGQGILNLSALLADDPDIDASDVYGYQISENLMFLWLQNPDIWEVVPLVDPADFNPWDYGEYEFTVTIASGPGVHSTAGMTVTVVPEPATLSLLALGALALRRKRR